MGDTDLFTKALLNWFKDNARDFPWRRQTDPYKILVAEKLLQQTSYGHVLKVYEKFIKKYPSLNDLAHSRPTEIMEVIKPLGFHNQRSVQLHNMAIQILERHSGKVPEARKELLKLDGVGPYVSNAVLCFAYRKNVPIVDVNVRRVLTRYFTWGDYKDAELESKVSAMILEGSAKDFNWGIIDFASQVCSRKPKCSKCPLATYCAYFNSANSSY